MTRVLEKVTMFRKSKNPRPRESVKECVQKSSDIIRDAGDDAGKEKAKITPPCRNVESPSEQT